MHFVQTRHLQPKNKLQEDIILEVEKWNGTLIDDEAKTCFLNTIRKSVDYFNAKNPKCKPCFTTGLNDVFSIKPEGEENAFETFVLLKVKATYDGIMRWQRMEASNDQISFQV